jgi:hypothetical protein
MAEGTAPQKPGIMDCAEIFYAPGEVFDRRRQGQFGIPLLVFVIATLVIFFATRNLIQPLMDLDFNRGMAKAMANNPQFTQEMVDKNHAIMMKFAPVGAAFFAVVVPFIVGLVVWLVAKFSGAVAGFKQAITIGVFSMFPAIVEQVGNAAQMAMNGGDITSKYDVSVGPARFMSGASEVLRTAVGHIDLWTIWMAFVIFVGVKVIGRTSKQTATIVAVVCWLIGGLPALIGAIRAS